MEPNALYAEIERLKRERDALADVLETLTECYVGLVSSGDCGNWDAETDVEVMAARALLAQVRK